MRTTVKQFVQVGDRVRYVGKLKYRYDNWTQAAWIEAGIEGTVIEYAPEIPATGAFKGIAAWATVQWDNGGKTGIHADNEHYTWERICNDQA